MTLCKYANFGESEIMVAEKISILMMRSSVAHYSKVRENASQGRQAEGLTITASTHNTNIQIRVHESTAFPPSAFRRIRSWSSQKKTRGLAITIRAFPTLSHTTTRSDAKNPCALHSQHATQTQISNATIHPSTHCK